MTLHSQFKTNHHRNYKAISKSLRISQHRAVLAIFFANLSVFVGFESLCLLRVSTVFWDRFGTIA